MDQACTATGLHHALANQDRDRADIAENYNIYLCLILKLFPVYMDVTEN